MYETGVFPCFQTAINSLDQGEGIEITDLDAYFDGVMTRVRAR